MLQPITLNVGNPGSHTRIDCLQEAHQKVAEEQELLRTEANAFSDFCARLDGIDCETKPREAVTSTSARHDTVAFHSDPVPPQGDTPIRDAYVETVMDTPHYEREYADSYWESITAEFGNEFAMMLDQAAVITPALKDHVLTAAQQSKAQRKQLISTLNREASALEEAHADLYTIAEETNAIRSRPFHDCTTPELQHLRADIDQLSAQCEELATRRQTGDLELHSVGAGLKNTLRRTKYFYESLQTTHPILDPIATISDQLTTTNQRITDILATRTA
ncbi:hypothetical protein LPA44_12735 [Halobacterium sp. KA-4]|uniref:DUF7260 family protein n=1 Tax=Halobacterium sp. KA-4 TaxID=2896367 RepID=UPI001E2C6635|nr:hypothetical protein [Halobacterium sp. KA-4]MCD2200757.1 hypothetical protein [Halobacterium sp. KA-4]